MTKKFSSWLSFTALLLAGCNSSTSTPDIGSADTASAPIAIVPPKTYEVSADDLLAARLPAAEAQQGWIRLFDGHTLYGWEIAGRTNWTVSEQTIVAEGGEHSLLCTSMPWKDFELRLDYRCGPQANSGIFLRTPLDPDGSGVDCYEVNLADSDSAFPSGSIVEKQKAQTKTPPSTEWRSLKIQVQENDITVSIAGKQVCTFTDSIDFPAGRIGLQHDQGRIEFRDIRLRPLGLKSLLGEDLSQWTKYPKMPGDFSMTDEGQLHVSGGRTQLESQDSFSDFVLLAEYKLPQVNMNSGIFFRCIPGEEMMGYECQVSNEMKDGNPLTPADHGTGGIFKRQEARLVAGNAEDWSTVMLVAAGPTIAAWVQGVQVSNWYDDRKPHENPRKGSRLDAGTLMIQGHDPETDAYFKQFKVVTIE